MLEKNPPSRITPEEVLKKSMLKNMNPKSLVTSGQIEEKTPEEYFLLTETFIEGKKYQLIRKEQNCIMNLLLQEIILKLHIIM
jgi:hypothetical protein